MPNAFGDNKPVQRLLKKTIILALVSAVLFAADYFPKTVEIVYSNGVYPLISRALRWFSGLFPFAIGDLCYIFLILIFLVKSFRFIRDYRKRKDIWKLLALQLAQCLLYLYVFFKLLWGLNYSRPQIYKQLHIGNHRYQERDLIALANLFLHKTDSLNHLIKTRKLSFEIGKPELFETSILAYHNLAQNYPAFRYNQPCVKPVLSAGLISNMGIEGYYNPLSGEANVNTILPNFVLPFVSCHEIAHQLGIAKEDEANLIGFLAAIHSDDIRFQYSAYYNMLRSVLLELRLKYPAAYVAIQTQISESVKSQFDQERQFWMPYNGMMANYMSASFDRLLKINLQEKGIDSYQDIVLWLYNYYFPKIPKQTE